LVQPAEPQPAVLDTPSEASQSAEDTASSEVQFTLLGADEIVRDEPAQAVEQVDDAAFDQPPSEISATPPVLVRDVLVIDPAAAGPHQMATPPLADVMASEGAPPEAEQPLAAEPSTQEIAAVPHESFPPPPVEHSAPAAEAETAAEAPLPSPLQLPRAIPTPALGAPAFVRPLSAAQMAPPVDRAPAITAAPAILAPRPPPSVATRRPRSVWPGRFRRAALVLVGLFVGYAALVLTLIVAYRWIDPPRSTLMLANHLTGEPVLYAPVPITRISSYLQRAVVTSEDARFCYHRGIDWAALYEAMNESRGGSTITMQTAKNLFLWPSRSYVRKAIEIPVAMAIDALWPKRRILEVYLNIAEWGPGIFGAEAAAHYHFDKPASRLTAHEATLLAASLPNPIARDAGEPGRVTEILASRLRARLGNSDAFVRCLGLRTMRPEPIRAPRTEPKAPQKSAPKSAATKAEPKIPPWRTTTDPAVNPWQN
jgi:monofunctional biosynthetic peptidoglycan transglycosylase